MSEPLDPEERFAEDLRAAFPAVPASEELADGHVAAMMAEAQLLADGTPALEQTPDPTPAGRISTWRRRMRERMFRRVVAVVTGALLSLGGLAVAAAFTGSGDDPSDDQAVVTDVPSDDLTDVDTDENEDADEDEDADDDAEDQDDADEREDADDDERETDDHEEADEREDADDRETDDHEDADERESDDDREDSDHDGGGQEDGGEEDGGGED